MKRISAYAAIYLLWGASFLAIRVVVADVPPFLAAGIRFLLAGVLLVVYSLGRGLPQPRGREWRGVALLAIVFFVGDYALLFWAEQKLPSGIAAVTAATIPAQVFLLEWLWLRRVRLTAITALGIALGLAGVVALVLPHGFAADATGTNRFAAVGVLAAFFWAVGTVISSQLTVPRDRPVNAGWQMTLGGIALLALSATTGEWRHVGTAALTPRVGWSMAYLVIFASLIAFSAYVYLLEHEPAQRVASYAYVNPITALLLGAFVGGESLTMRQIVACAVVIAGVLITLVGRQSAAIRS
jgi:drug/metabolite transporter (DMT)-like permease